MGDSNPADSEEKETVNRRGFMQGVAGVVGAAALGTSGLAAGQTSTTVNLGDEGLSPGDDITPYLDEHWQSGAHVVIPGGRYQVSNPGDAFSIDATEDSWLEGDGLVTLESGYSTLPITADNGAHVRLQNLEWDTKLDGGIKTYTLTTDSVLELVNVNIHGENGTGSYGVYGAGEGDNVGTVRLVNCVIDHFSDGLYFSSPFEADSPDDGKALIEVYGGLYHNNEVNNIRIGGDDATVAHVASVHDDPNMAGTGDGIRIRESGDNMQIIDCDVTITGDSNGRDCIRVTNTRFESDRGNTGTVKNSRLRQEKSDYEVVNMNDPSGFVLDGVDNHISGGGDDDIETAGDWTGTMYPPDSNTPTTEKRVVDLDTLEPLGTDDSTSTSSSDSTEDATPKHLEIRTFSDSGIVYEFTVDGTVEPGDSAETYTGGNDSIADNGDGTYTVTGTTGNGYTDEFDFGGQVVAWSAERHPNNTSGEYQLVLDGSTVLPDELTASSDDGTTDDSSTDDSSTDDGSSGSGAPVVETYDVSEAGSMNPHADIIAKWNVSDPDGDLSSVLVQVLNSSGVVLAASRSSLDGSSAQDVDYFKIKRVDGQTFDVRLTVTDAQGNTATGAATVTE